MAAMTGVDGVIARMEGIGGAMPAGDGVARFNDLYLAVTRAVVAELAGAGEFEDPDFMVDLDVAFAGIYFAAIDRAAAGRAVDHAWRPLFDARGRARIAPIQFALAGMNAHINHDLALALVAVHRAHGAPPRDNSPQRRDFDCVNAILERVEREVKERFASGLVGVADVALGRLDDVIAMWSVARAREAAWTQAEALWVIGDVKFLRDRYVETLSRTVGLAGRGMLVPTL